MPETWGIQGEICTRFIYKNNLAEYIKTASDLLGKYPEKILLPVDVAYVDPVRREVNISDLPVDDLIVDIGHQTVELYKEVIGQASTVFINGPMGIFENAESEYGTKTVWESVADSRAYSVLGGGDSITAVNKYNLVNKVSYICTGGGALVRFLSGEGLPVVRALRDAAERV
ncbi:MAG: phosphoglycerate kinase [Desulfitobacteriaceae bacterium]